MNRKQLLKKDLFGEVWRIPNGPDAQIMRDTRSARWWVRAIARALMRREASALAALVDVTAVPKLINIDRHGLTRSFLAGTALHQSRNRNENYFAMAMKLLRTLHRANVVHNDLAKEPNILVLDNGRPGFIDFQLASYAPRRGRLFRIAAHEDIRHLLKHKRTYQPDELTAREHRILNTRSVPSRLWMSLVKPLYLFVTRRLLGWADREGASDRGKVD